MLSDQGADLVMADIEWHTKVVMGLEFGTGPTDQAVSNAVLNHLYDLHKLRDDWFFDDLMTFADIAMHTRAKLWEMQDA